MSSAILMSISDRKLSRPIRRERNCLRRETLRRLSSAARLAGSSKTMKSAAEISDPPLPSGRKKRVFSAEAATMSMLTPFLFPRIVALPVA